MWKPQQRASWSDPQGWQSEAPKFTRLRKLGLSVGVPPPCSSFRVRHCDQGCSSGFSFLTPKRIRVDIHQEGEGCLGRLRGTRAAGRPAVASERGCRAAPLESPTCFRTATHCFCCESACAYIHRYAPRLRVSNPPTVEASCLSATARTCQFMSSRDGSVRRAFR
jgi:hypothetical protein